MQPPSDYDTLFEYVTWLTKANQAATGTTDLRLNLPVYIFGALSEVYETQEAEPANAVGEASDVLAYATLGLVALGMSPTLFASYFANPRQATIVSPPLQALTNDASKLFRGDSNRDYSELVQTSLVQLILWASTVVGASPVALAIVNQQKLQQRLANNNNSFKDHS